MLTSLLPGIRELRTPLAVGFLWLTAAWLVWGGLIPEESEASRLVALVYRAVDALGTSGSVGALTFVAYVLGAVLSWEYVVHRVTANWDLRSGSADPRRVFASNWLRRAGMGFISEGAVEDVRDHLLKRIRHAVDSGRHTMPEIADIATRRDERPPRPEPDAVAAGLYRRLADELPELVTRLALLEKDRLWDTYDRQIAEAEFRQAVSLPLSVVIVAIAVIGPPWVAVGLVVPALFLVQGLRRAQRARSEVYLAVVQGIIRSYVLDLVGDVPDETSRPDATDHSGIVRRAVAAAAARVCRPQRPRGCRRVRTSAAQPQERVTPAPPCP